MFAGNRRSALRTARAEGMARIGSLAARVLADPADDVLAERLATARLLSAPLERDLRIGGTASRIDCQGAKEAS